MVTLNKKILVIEDDNMISSMYKTKFEAEGFAVFIADDGAKGLELAKQEKPDIIMLDVILPRLDGFSVLEELKKDSATKDIPVIMLTNLGTEEDKVKGEKLGAADYLVKASLTPGQVSQKIKTALHI
ncbi:response regulator [bacterium (Candidatus Gribaldobacteria) CG02_land_8_20_14_3_00_41_15]|uniref:Response regulator n=1 Tax=bacterium (Candidatus Gribaldobacteria) CG02_land_8_20_14_3_00_41_15 TaxID=2014270 RepID=A0A2M7DDQ1_9BACT|nr:MAG: response regulator [bacterium (Candidatus Gribaldobacteria) CG02_land_8_20_14_3_00_41_15]